MGVRWIDCKGGREEAEARARGPLVLGGTSSSRPPRSLSRSLTAPLPSFPFPLFALFGARLKNILLRTMMQKLEARIKSKEELAGGLHLIDFEQLKIENQSYNEKIEERSEELLRLRKKTTTTVQVLTHLKEKLQYVEKDNARHEEALHALEARLAHQRDTLVRCKLRRDVLRAECTQLKSQCSIVTSAVLKDDIAAFRERRDALQERVASLQGQHKSLSGTLVRMRAAMGTPTAGGGGYQAPGGRGSGRGTSGRFASLGATG